MHDSNPSPGELSGILESYNLPIVGVEQKEGKKLFRNWHETFFKEVEEKRGYLKTSDF